MSDAAVDLGATDVWGLTTAAGFHAQESSTEDFSTESLALAADGDKACSNEHNTGENVEARYKYCGTTLRTSLGVTLTSFGRIVGTGAAAIVMTDLEINMPGNGEQTEITIRGHRHTTSNHSATTNPTNVFNVASIVPVVSGLGVTALWVSAGETATTASRASATLSISCNHVDKEANGGHFTAESITCRVDGTMDYEGNASTITAGSWLQILSTQSDENEGQDTSQVTAHQYVDAT